MMDRVERRGQVIALVDGVARVRLAANAGCSGCSSGSSCASSNAGGPVVSMQLPVHTQPGDHVTVSMPASTIVFAALLGYMVPPVGLLLGAVLAEIAYGGDLAAVIGGAAGLLTGLVLARLISPCAVGHASDHSVCHHESIQGDPS